jgi:putative oxidoreductase
MTGGDYQYSQLESTKYLGCWCKLPLEESEARWSQREGEMRMLENLIGTDADWAVASVRIILGIVFFAHGAQKMLGWFGGYGFKSTMRAFVDQMKIPAPFAFLVIVAEFFGGLGLIVGFLSRLAAIGIIATMVGAVFLVHLQYGFFVNWYGNKKGHGFEFHLLACALALIVFIEGAGPFSVDRVWYQHEINPDASNSETFGR